MRPRDPLELEDRLKRELDRRVEAQLPALDARLAPVLKASTLALALDPPSRARRRRGVRGLALAAIALALALGLGFFWGSQHPHPGLEPTGPRALPPYAQPQVAFRGAEAPLVALYRSAGAISVPTETPSTNGKSVEITAVSISIPVSAPPPSARVHTLTLDQPRSESYENENETVPSAPAPASPVASAWVIKFHRADGVTVQHGPLLLNAPSGMGSIGFLGEDVLVPDTDGGRIVRLTAAGERVTVAHGLDRPAGVAADALGNLFVTESLPQGRLLKIRAGEETPTPILSGLVYPAGLAFGPDGALYLAESGRGRVLRLRPVEGQILADSPVEVIATGFSGALQVDLGLGQGEGAEPAPARRGPLALAVSPSGALWVADTVGGETVIYRLDLPSRRPWWGRLRELIQKNKEGEKGE